MAEVTNNRLHGFEFCNQQKRHDYKKNTLE